MLKLPAAFRGTRGDDAQWPKSDAMPAGAPLIVVANDRHDLYPQIATLIGVEVEGVVRRHVNRRTGMRSSEYYESVFVWKKQ